MAGHTKDAGHFPGISFSLKAAEISQSVSRFEQDEGKKKIISHENLYYYQLCNFQEFIPPPLTAEQHIMRRSGARQGTCEDKSKPFAILLGLNQC